MSDQNVQARRGSNGQAVSLRGISDSNNNPNRLNLAELNASRTAAFNSTIGSDNPDEIQYGSNNEWHTYNEWQQTIEGTPATTGGENPRREAFPRGISFALDLGVGTQVIGNHTGSIVSRGELRLGVRVPLGVGRFFVEPGIYLATSPSAAINDAGTSRARLEVGGGGRVAFGYMISPWDAVDVSPYAAIQFGAERVDCGDADETIDPERLRSFGLPVDGDTRTGQAHCQLIDRGPAYHQTGVLAEISAAIGIRASVRPLPSVRLLDSLRLGAFGEFGRRMNVGSITGDRPDDFPFSINSSSFYGIVGASFEFGNIQTGPIVTRHPTVSVTESILSPDGTSLRIPRGQIPAGATHYVLVNGTTNPRRMIPANGDLEIPLSDLENVTGIDFTDNANPPHILKTFSIPAGFVSRYLGPLREGETRQLSAGMTIMATTPLTATEGQPFTVGTISANGSKRVEIRVDNNNPRTIDIAAPTAPATLTSQPITLSAEEMGRAGIHSVSISEPGSALAPAVVNYTVQPAVPTGISISPRNRVPGTPRNQGTTVEVGAIGGQFAPGDEVWASRAGRAPILLVGSASYCIGGRLQTCGGIPGVFTDTNFILRDHVAITVRRTGNNIGQQQIFNLTPPAVPGPRRQRPHGHR